MAQKGNMSTKHLWALSRHVFLSIVLVGLLVSFIPFSVVKADPPSGHVVTFPDANLEAAIREAIVKPAGSILQSDLDTLFTLGATGRGITNLTGLEHCTRLASLDLSNNQISDIMPTENLTSLTILNLHTNQISDISPLAGLTNLTEVVLRNNQISDISPLAGLANLTDLHLADNQISGISPLAGLSRLTILNLNTNQIIDISPLAGLTNLTELVLHTNQISDILPTENLTSLTELYLGINQIIDISPLAGLTKLTMLNLHINQIIDIEPLADNPGIASGDTVYLNTNPLSSTSIDAYIPALEARGVEVYWDVPDTSPPNQPGNVSPGNGAVAVSLTPTLQSSVFFDPDAGDTHAASRWQVSTTSGDYSGSVFDSHTDNTSLTSITIPSSTLDYSTTYYWHVRHKNIHGAWSPWSGETSFTTVPTYPLVTTNAANNITTTSATLHGDLTWLGTAMPVTVSFEWGTTTSYGSETTPVSRDATGGFTAKLTDLSAKTTYHFRAKAVGDGTGWGGDVTFTTSTTRPPSVTTTAASAVASTSATLNGNLTSLGTAGGVTVSFVWGLTDDYGNETSAQPGTPVGSFTANLTGLSAKTTYHFRAKAVGNGTGWGDDVTFTTSTVLPSVTTNDATSVATTSATLNGDLSSLGTAAIVTVSFEYITKSGGSYSPVAVVVVGVKDSTGAFSADLSGLTSGTTYYYRAKAVGDGAFIYGAEKSFATSVTPPTATTSSATSLTTTSARLNANLVSLGTKSSVTVSFLWKVSGGTYTETTGQAKTAAGALFADLSGLAQGTTYYYKAKVVGDGDPVYGEEKSFTTTDGTALGISVVTSFDITTSGVTVTWTTNEAATSQIEYGLTEEYGSTTALDTNLVTSHSVDLIGLKAGKTYHYRVISKDAANNQAESADGTFTTARSGGIPVWAWVLIVLGVVGVLGAAAYLIRGRLAQ